LKFLEHKVSIVRHQQVSLRTHRSSGDDDGDGDDGDVVGRRNS